MGTRVPKYTAEDVEISLTKSLQKLQTDYLDLYQVSMYLDQAIRTNLYAVVAPGLRKIPRRGCQHPDRHVDFWRKCISK